MVIFHYENHPYSQWKLGKVTDVIEGDDNQIRGAVLDVVNGKTKTLHRSITHLYPLEIISVSFTNESYSQLHHSIKMAQRVGGTLYRDH